MTETASFQTLSKMKIFENPPFFRTHVDECKKKLFRHGVGLKTKLIWRTDALPLVLGLLSSIIAQWHAFNYIWVVKCESWLREKTTQHTQATCIAGFQNRRGIKRLNIAGRQARPRRFWVRPGGTSQLFCQLCWTNIHPGRVKGEFRRVQSVLTERAQFLPHISKTETFFI